MDPAQKKLLERLLSRIERQLQYWVNKKPILQPGEQLIFELKIVRAPTVVGHLSDGTTEIAREALPPLSTHTGINTLWTLTEEDWNKLAALPWDEEQTRILEMLRAGNNTPCHKSECAAKVARWYGGFTNRFNRVLDKAGDFQTNDESGVHYKLCQFGDPHDGKYAIEKTQRCPKW